MENPKRRQRRKEARPSEIVEAARMVFLSRGFAASKVEEIARLAGVSKGTVYLYFPTKEAVFEEVMRANIVSVIDSAESLVMAESGVPAPMQLRFVLETMYRELVSTERRRLMHLMIAEGPHFPSLLQFYHREVISRGLAMIRHIVERGARRGEFRPQGMERYPKLIVGPAVLAALYGILFADQDPLDLDDYSATHIAAVMRALGAEGPGAA